MPRSARWVLVAALLSACPEEPDPPPIEAPDVLAAAPPGASWAAVVAQGQEAGLPGGIGAEGQAGDVKLWNDRVVFVIQGTRDGHGYVPTGGIVIDADRARAPGEPGQDTLEELFQSFGIGWLFQPDAVAVAQAGLDGGDATVRASGRAIPWQFIQGALELSDPLLADPGVAMTVDYVLPPDSDVLRVRTTLHNDGSDTVRFNLADGWIAAAEDLDLYVPGEGVGGSMDAELAAAGIVGQRGEPAILLWPTDRTLSPLGIAAAASASGITAFTYGWVDLPAGDTWTIERKVAVGDDPAAAERARFEEEGLPFDDVEVFVEADGQPVAGARVQFVRDDGLIGPFARTDDAGRALGALPPGNWEAWAVAAPASDFVDLPDVGRYSPYADPAVNARQLDALADGEPVLRWARGLGVAGPAAVVPGLTLNLPGSATLSARVGDADGPLPAWLQITRVGDALDDVPADLREPFGLPFRLHPDRVFTGDGAVDVPLPPGRYGVRVEHGFRHAPQTFELDLVAGGVTSLDATLQEVVPRDGWTSIDSHLHAAPSTDADLSMEERLLACAIGGVDVAITTDHDRAADYAPLLEPLGLAGRLRTVPGVEVSSTVRGHFNTYPLEPDLLAPNGGAPSWWDPLESTAELFGRARAAAPGGLIQLNHPRDQGVLASSGYANHTGEASNPSRFSWDFDAMEIINATGAGDRDILVQDWFSMIERGHRVVPMGVSDSHGLGAPCGFGRTDVYAPDGDVVAAVRAGHTVVAGGLTLRVQGPGGAVPGDTVSGSTIPLQIALRAPPQMVPRTLRVWVNREVVWEQALDAPDGATWFDEGVEVEVDGDSWIAVEALGDTPIGGLWGGGRPYALTSAFFVDADGGGWTPPLP